MLRSLGLWVISREDYSWSEYFPLPCSGKLRVDPICKHTVAHVVTCYLRFIHWALMLQPSSPSFLEAWFYLQRKLYFRVILSTTLIKHQVMNWCSLRSIQMEPLGQSRSRAMPAMRVGCHLQNIKGSPEAAWSQREDPSRTCLWFSGTWGRAGCIHPSLLCGSFPGPPYLVWSWRHQV